MTDTLIPPYIPTEITPAEPTRTAPDDLYNKGFRIGDKDRVSTTKIGYVFDGAPTERELMFDLIVQQRDEEIWLLQEGSRQNPEHEFANGFRIDDLRGQIDRLKERRVSLVGAAAMNFDFTVAESANPEQVSQLNVEKAEKTGRVQRIFKKIRSRKDSSSGVHKNQAIPPMPGPEYEITQRIPVIDVKEDGWARSWRRRSPRGALAAGISALLLTGSSAALAVDQLRNDDSSTTDTAQPNQLLGYLGTAVSAGQTDNSLLTPYAAAGASDGVNSTEQLPEQRIVNELENKSLYDVATEKGITDLPAAVKDMQEYANQRGYTIEVVYLDNNNFFVSVETPDGTLHLGDEKGNQIFLKLHGQFITNGEIS